MRISELKRTANFVKTKVADPDIPAKFRDLIEVLKTNAQMRPGSQPQPITEQKAALVDAIKSAQPQKLTLNERKLLQNLIDASLMGVEGVERINNIFSEHNLDPMGAVNAFTAIKESYEQLVKSAANILSVLEPIDVGKIEDDIQPGRAVLQITFKHKASINNVIDWRDYSKQWFEIIRAFGLLAENPPEDAKVISFETGSIIVEISAAYLVIKGLGLAADKILGVLEKVLDLRKKVAEIKHLDLTNKQIEIDLQKEADSFQENKIARIADQVISEVNATKSTDGEVSNAIQMSVKNLLIFLDRGGTVDCRLPEAEDGESPESKQLRAVYGKIRQLEMRLEETKLITEKSEKPTEET